MKKTIIITVGIILILIVLAVWAYLLFFGSPKNSNEIFANLGLGGNTTVTPAENAPIATPDKEQTTQLAPKQKALRQLTTRPVAGFGFVGTSTSLVRYAERGTGHIFEINVDDNTEQRISGTTIPRIVEAEFSPYGLRVVFTIENGYTRDLMLGTINKDGDKTDFINLPPASFDPWFVSDSVLRYAVKTKNGTEGYETDIIDGVTTRLFSIPLRDITMVWKNKETYAYNRPALTYKGSLYKINGSELMPVTPGEFGFIGGMDMNYYFGTAIADDSLYSYAIDKKSGEQISLAVTYTPEKCTAVASNPVRLWCASTFKTMRKDSLLTWYKGALQMEDILWSVDITRGEASLSSNFLKESGRVVDVDEIKTDYLGLVPVFRNKVDGTLWLYDSRLE